MNAFTKAILKEMVRKEHLKKTAATCRFWQKTYPDDREKAEVEFAGQLREDVTDGYQDFGGLIRGFMEIGFMNTNWRTVAATLLDRFCPLPEKHRVVFQGHRFNFASLN